ncbi:ribbon-helix-helix protein, CopG family [Stackebrandtia soli]|uniref:ribbon-helix-helix protein, CopG family n=1 Tax=Stackebrandtia soli TaxID=1892856 RepID=UPI0039ED8A5E
MDLTPFIESVRRELAVAADPDGENRAVAERMASALTPTIRLMLLNALSTAADDITIDLAPGSVEVRLRGGEPSFVVTPPMSEQPTPAAVEPTEPDGAKVVPSDIDDGPMSRINLRLSEQLKARIEEDADREGRSVNAWLVRAAAIVLDSRGRESSSPRPTSSGTNRFTGWVR